MKISFCQLRSAFWCSVIVLFTTISCSEENQPAKGSASFSFTNSSAAGSRIQETASKLLVSIKDDQGQLLHDKLELSLYNFEGEFISEPLVLDAGNYSLEEFIVLNASNEVLYVCPIEGSSLAYLVEKPLAIDFVVEKDEVSNVIPEVISAEGNAAIDFGYATFSFSIVNTLKFLSSAFIYNSSTNDLELASHTLLVKSGNDTLYYSAKPNSTTHTVVRSSYENYTLTFSKTGYVPVVRNYAKATLLSDFQTSPITIVFLPLSVNAGLVAYYPFNGNANDVAGNNFNGSVTGAVLATDKNGQANSAYSFDGVDDYISIAHNSQFNFENQDFTISFWAYIPETQAPGNEFNDILRKWNGDAQGYPYSISYRNNQVIDANTDRLFYATYDGQACGNATSGPSSATVDNTKFVHIVFQREGNVVRQYLDKQLVSELTQVSSACSRTSTANVTLGCRGNLVRFFKGKIDNVRFYNRKLSTEEINTLFAAE